MTGLLGRGKGPLEICSDELKEQLEWLCVVVQLCIAFLVYGVGGELDI